AHHPAQARELPRRLRWVRPGRGGALRRARHRAAARRRRHRPPPREDRGGDRERERRARAAGGENAARRAHVGLPRHHRVEGALRAPQERRFPLRRTDDGLRRHAGLRDRQRPHPGVLGPGGRRARARQLRALRRRYFSTMYAPAATAPPSTEIVTPVMNPESGEARKSAVCAISSTVPKRAIAPCCGRSLSASAVHAPSMSSVSIGPGAIAFTVIPRSARSSAAARVRPTTPALAEP